MKRYDLDNNYSEMLEDGAQWVRYEDVAKLEAAAKAVIKANDVFPWDGFENALSELRKCLEGK